MRSWALPHQKALLACSRAEKPGEKGMPTSAGRGGAKEQGRARPAPGENEIVSCRWWPRGEKNEPEAVSTSISFSIGERTPPLRNETLLLYNLLYKYCTSMYVCTVCQCSNSRTLQDIALKFRTLSDLRSGSKPIVFWRDRSKVKVRVKNSYLAVESLILIVETRNWHQNVQCGIALFPPCDVEHVRPIVFKTARYRNIANFSKLSDWCYFCTGCRCWVM